MPIVRRPRTRTTRHHLAPACRAAIEHLEVRTLLTATIYVDANAPGNGGGSSWQNAAHDLQTALTAAQSGDEIRVADGTYKPTIGADRSATFALKSGVHLLGGYAGYGAPDPDARDVAQYPTILSGDIGTAGDTTDNSYHVLTGSGVDASALLDSFTITAGNANGNSAAGQMGGGGMYNVAGSPTVNNCTFTANSSPLFVPSGGAIYNKGSSPTLTNCTFSANSAYAGGAIYNANASAPTISHCTFAANSASATAGAIYNASSSPVLTDCTFTGNVSESAGAIYNDSSNPTLTRCTFTANRAYYPRVDGLESAYGGAIYNRSSSPSLNLCTFDRNNASSATSGGGAIYNDTSSPSIVNCLFTRNSAGNGGAIENDRASAPTFTNCAFAANNAAGEYRGTGGAIYNTTFATANLVNCTLAGNAALTGTGGIVSTNGASITLTNSIVWGNTTPPAQTAQVIGPFTATYSDLPGGASGAGNLDTDPLFVRNPTPGPDGRWGTDDDDPGDLRLSPTSPVADAGNNLALTSGVTTDLAGAPRFMDIPTTADRGAGTAPIVDPGAYEAAPALAADVGGPYAVLQGHQIQLNAHGSSNVPGVLQFAWDLNGDGAYDDATGPTPTFDAGARPASQFNVSVRVTDSAGKSVTDTTALRVAPLIVYVDAAATAGHAGASWADARSDLAAVLNLALFGQQIRVAKGTYKPTDGADRFATFQLTSGVTILGGYAGQTAPDPDARDVAANPTILSGQIGNQADDSDNSYHVVTASGVDASTLLDGFTITDGNASDRDFNSSGGGIYIRTGSPTLRNCTFTANHAFDGGGMGNTDSSAPALVNCTFVGNTAENRGGAIADFIAAPTLTGCTFLRNSAQESGGAIHNDSSSPRIVDCRFDGNSAASTRFSSAVGGAICNSLSPATVINCEFTGNYARVGGAIDNSSSASVITNCTFAGNSAELYGGAFYTYANAPTLTNCILWGNAARTGPQVYRADTTLPVIRYSDVQGGWTGTGNINADPLFVRAPAPGPDGRWGTTDDDFGDLRLSGGSPAIDAGDNTAPGLAGITTDLAGNPRFTDVPTAPDTGNGPAPIVDMGAYEATATPALIGDANSDHVVDFNDLVILAQNYNTTGKTWSQGDFNGDGSVDFKDLTLLAQHYNTSLAPASVPAPAPAAPTPAPSPAKSKAPRGKPIFSIAPVVQTKSRGDRRPTRYAHR